ncbi:hypothetical protein [Lyngbya sp. PCC 8106]|uniref:hypothetical protein n=1 Tax=Lyngbya sp. (strain PCC 8106) TaxID=313612 RepID=UPI0000EA8CD9|nr:hypothetical protein [Lyngbya sp. PCC 8106]EAW36320.1 hypothetical protein L8106_23361 [Lyngbya sp. PCC 8106]
MKLGEILLKKKLISSTQLEQALNLQCLYSEKLGELLINKGWLQSHDLDKALREQYWRQQGFWVID